MMRFITWIKARLRLLGVDIVKFNKSTLSNRDLYEHDLKVMIQRNNPVVFDVGANNGQSIEVFLKIFKNPHVFSFEPNHKLYKILHNKYKNNPHVYIFPDALGSEKGKKTLYVYKADVLSSLKPIEQNIANPFNNEILDDTLTCDVVSLDTFVESNNITCIDLLKIDTQGYEFEVLSGAKNSLRAGLIKSIYIEINFVELYKDQSPPLLIFDLLFSLKFKLVGLYDLDRPNKYIRWCNALFTLVDDSM